MSNDKAEILTEAEVERQLWPCDKECCHDENRGNRALHTIRQMAGLLDRWKTTTGMIAMQSDGVDRLEEETNSLLARYKGERT